jgi:asparagine synthase (glutamine-hydrolysing)
MCGIAGFWQPPGENVDRMTERVRQMAATLRHRGPDDEGSWIDPDAGVALGFRRLAILDLSPSGHQPMTSADERYTLVFNGEIYNYKDLKAELATAGYPFRGTSDTEVILAGFCLWGFERTIARMSGMFGLAVWDADIRTLTLARDRVGKKPVYYGRAGNAWLFASELKALRAFPGFTPVVDRDALTQFLRFTYVPAPLSIYKGVFKLPPGHFVRLSRDGDSAATCYWDAAKVARDGQRNPLQIDDEDAVAQLDGLLRDAVARRMVADVPLGAFLSGGLDSSTVVALMQAQSATPIRTFTIGFNDEDYNEAEAAKGVARYLGTDHSELYVTPEQARCVIPALPSIYDEPFADSSQIPTYLVSRFAREQVTVSLSGDGGDELFGGYNRYFWAPAIWNRMKHVPLSVRRVIANAVGRTPSSVLDGLYSAVEPALPTSWELRLPGDKAHKLAGMLDAADEMDLYKRLTSAWHSPELLVRDPGTTRPSHDVSLGLDRFCERMMLRDLLGYLPDDILVKVDRASMAVGLEARAPLLDSRVVEWAWRLPSEMRVRDGDSKWLLRQVLYRYVPQKLLERPKMGFGIPVDDWLRGPLREWAEGLLAARALEESGLNPEPIRATWCEHLGGHHNQQTRLWPILMFQAWRECWHA